MAPRYRAALRARVHSPAGQSAIRLRRALAHGEADAAAALVPELDADHRIEILLGAALRDGRDGFAAAKLYLDAAGSDAADPTAWHRVCTALSSPGDTAADDIAAAWVASGRVPDAVRGGGRALSAAERAQLAEAPEAALVALIGAGVALDALLAAFADHPLYPAVNAYYRGGIRALGWRPCLLLGIVAAT